MKFGNTLSYVVKVLCVACALQGVTRGADAATDRVQSVVDNAIAPLMQKDQIPGMAVGVVVAGQPRVFNYGVMSKETGRPVTNATLFELGSVSKTFAATLASWAAQNHQLSLSDNVAKYLPSLSDRPFGSLSLLDLGTHTPGVLPLQVPDEVRSDADLIAYLGAWRPTRAAGTYRTYSNPGIGVLGLAASKSMGQDYTALIEQRLFPALAMKNSFIDVPASRAADYAQGYAKDGKPVRLAGGVIAPEAYGVKSTAADMVRFMESNMKLIELDAPLQRAITATHTGYFKAGPMTQDLVWEQYPYPVSLSALKLGNGPDMAFKATPVTRISPPEAPRDDVWINKTGSTNGFGSYVAFIPGQRLGIVMLANRNFPNEDRVAVAYRILTSLANIQQ
jgi:beta-lactamase class C